MMVIHQKNLNQNSPPCFTFKLAEREGFEPPVPFGTTVFKTAAIDHSAISPPKYPAPEGAATQYEISSPLFYFVKSSSANRVNLFLIKGILSIHGMKAADKFLIIL